MTVIEKKVEIDWSDLTQLESTFPEYRKFKIEMDNKGIYPIIITN